MTYIYAPYLYTISSIVASVFCVSLAVLVYLKGRKHVINRSFGMISFFAGIWTLFPFLSAVAPKDSAATLLVRGVYFAAVFVPPAFLNFVLSLVTKKKNKNEEKILLLSYLVSFGFFIFNFTPLLIKSVARYAPNFYIIPGPAYHFFVLFFGLVCLYAFFKLLYAFRRSIGYQRQQFKYVFIAFILAYIGGLMHFLPSYFGARAEPFPHDSLLIGFAGIIAYAILRHRLMDMEFVIKRTAVYSLLTAVLTALFVSFVLIGERFFRDILGYHSLWAGVMGAFVVALVFQPLRDGIQRLVDRVFFRARYDYQRILRKYVHALSQPMKDLDRFSRLVPYILNKSLKLKGTSVMVLDRSSNKCIVRSGEKDAEDLVGISIPDDSALISELINRRKEITLEEVEYYIKSGTADKAKYEKIAAEMKRLKTVLIIPSISESQYFKKPTLIATINLGRKLSDEAFSREDIDFLIMLADQATVNIEYAFIFEELVKNQERLVRSEKLAAVGATTAGVAHELKNPLTYLSAVSQILPHKWDDPAFKESVSKMLPSEIQRMQLIVEGLLNYSRSKELALVPLDIKEVIDKTLALLAYEIRKNSVSVKTDYKHTRKASGDPNRLVQVFMNIIANAVQAMGEQGGELVIASSDGDGVIKITIEDTGPGIPEDKIKNIFDPFFTTKEAGTGLGLPISKKIVDEHKGTISVESILGKGTTFTVSIPHASS